MPNEDTGEARPTIDVLHRLLWLLEKRPALIADFIADANPSIDQLRLVAQALAGPALKGGEMDNVSPTAEQSALGKNCWRTGAISLKAKPSFRIAEQDNSSYCRVCRHRKSY